MSEEYEKAVGDILSHFDFGKVHRAMVALNWWWGVGAGGTGVPDEAKLREKAYLLLSGLETKHVLGDVNIESGGLRASLRHCIDGQPQLKLEFVLASTEKEIRK